MHADVEGIADPCSTTSSFAGSPVAESNAPAGFELFAHPRPLVPKFAHGQSVDTFGSTLSPAQNDAPLVGSRTSWMPFSDPKFTPIGGGGVRCTVITTSAL